jgi:hypothetical protein
MIRELSEKRGRVPKFVQNYPPNFKISFNIEGGKYENTKIRKNAEYLPYFFPRISVNCFQFGLWVWGEFGNYRPVSSAYSFV